MGIEDDRLVAQLAELGVEARLLREPPTRSRVRVLRLTRGASVQDFELLSVPHAQLSSVRAPTAERPVFVHTGYVAAKTGDAFRRAGVQYLDAVGNAWIRFGDVLVDVRGRPRPDRHESGARASGNLFSSGRAQVILALLAWPLLWDAPQRDVARAAGVSLGQANNTLALLAQAGYDGQQVRSGGAGLLDLWTAAFPTGLAQRLTLATYQGDIAAVKKPRAGDTVTVSGEAAVPELLRPTSLALYVLALDPRLSVVNRWRADGEPNIVIRRKFWNDPDVPGALSTDIEIAPWPLVYADLLAASNPRARHTAKEFRERHERPQ